MASSSLTSSQQLFLHPQKITKLPFSTPLKPFTTPPKFPTIHVASSSSKTLTLKDDNNKSKPQQQEIEIEIEEDLPWIQEKALDLVEFTGSVAIPGPRVGRSSLSWIIAVPLAYIGVSFVIDFVNAVNKFTSPKAKRRRLVNKNAGLCKSIDGLFEKGLQSSALQELSQMTGFSMEDILSKYIRYALNEKPFNPELVLSLIQLRKATILDDSQVAEILNEVSRRIVKEEGKSFMKQG